MVVENNIKKNGFVDYVINHLLDNKKRNFSPYY